MMIEVAVTVCVSAAHRDMLSRLHGHDYHVEVWYPAGGDLIALRAFTTDVSRAVDHSMLEDSIGSPNMEDLAAWFLTRIPTAARVVVSRSNLDGVKAMASR